MTKRDIPEPFYAAAGAGDLAYQQLRKLPDAANRSLRVAGETAASLRERAASGETRLRRDRLPVDMTKLRESAQRGAATFISSAASVQERAVTGYRSLVAHGEQVVSGGPQTPDATPTEIASPATQAPDTPDAPAAGVEEATGAGDTSGDERANTTGGTQTSAAQKRTPAKSGGGSAAKRTATR